ncbi:hypothetical protein IL306_007452 [Fusarium sp. DS 682]|nr:hypothetical protein IL306_007452 [Fusarium sp. DS 682]
MRGKRSKQYRKLMEQFSQTFGFREPYQVLVDAEMVRDSSRFKMDLEAALSRTVHGKVKLMITQCEIRKLYAARNEPGVHEAIDLAKTLERRRCGHHPDDYPEPLSTRECLRSVVDPKDTLQNKHRYVVASQEQEVRKMLRGIRGVPLIYIKRSVMILEPMADESVQVRAKEERSKFRAEIKNALGKRKREDADEDEKADKKTDDNSEEQKKKKKKKKGHGPKGPNPLAVQKPKKAKTEGQQRRKQESTETKDTPQEGTGKRKRRRRNKTATDTTEQGETDAAAPEVTTAET